MDEIIGFIGRRSNKSIFRGNFAIDPLALNEFSYRGKGRIFVTGDFE